MSSFLKANSLVDSIKEKFPNDKIESISVVFNTNHIMKSDYGRYIKPICVFIKNEGEDSRTRIDQDENEVFFNIPQSLENEVFFNIPQSLDYIVDMIKEKYAAIEIDPREARIYKDDKIFYTKALAVIRNPKLISELEDIEKDSISIKEFTF